MAKQVDDISAHWHHLIEGMSESSQKFYELLETAIKERKMPDTKVSRVSYKEGGILSGKREYLRVAKDTYIFDICAAPFGTGFFVSWWLGSYVSFIEKLSKIPFIGLLVCPITYYKIDTMIMFRESVSSIVAEVTDKLIETKGLRKLSDEEKKPIMKELFGKMKF